MIGELAESYGVRKLTAVLKRENARSFRLLERLGFSPASDASLAGHDLDAGEILMERDIGTKRAGRGPTTAQRKGPRRASPRHG